MTLTATAEFESPPQPAEVADLATAERPVFAATTATRPRALRLTGRVVAGLVGLWLVALVLGTFGFGSVAGIGLPRIGGADHAEHRAAARKAPVERPGERVSRSGVTLTTRATGAPASAYRSGPAAAKNRTAGGQAPSSHAGTGGSGSQSGGRAGSGHHAGTTHTPVPSPATPSSTATSATPAPASTTAQTTSNSHSTNSQATPPGSSSSAPGSRSNAGTAPGRGQSASTPTPGSGRTEHAPPKG